MDAHHDANIRCPFCRFNIDVAATRCGYCGWRMGAPLRDLREIATLVCLRERNRMTEKYIEANFQHSLLEAKKVGISVRRSNQSRRESMVTFEGKLGWGWRLKCG